MPTYDYVCDACGHTFEAFQDMSAKKLRKCPKCGKNALVRQVGAGAGLIFKGTGFYITDYGRGKTAPESVSTEKSGASNQGTSGSSTSGAPSGGGDAGSSAGKEAGRSPKSEPGGKSGGEGGSKGGK